MMRIVLVVLIVVVAAPVGAATSKLSADGNARLFLPDVVGPVRPPLLVMLHGRGSRRQHMDAVAPTAVEAGFVVVTINAPIPLGPGKFQWPPGADIEAVLKRISTYLSGFPETASERQWYVAGFSQGAWYAVLLAMAHPETVRGVLSMSAVMMADMPRLSAPKQIPLVLWAGYQDRYAERAAEFFADLWRRAGSPVKLERFDGGHTLPQDWRLRLPVALQFLRNPEQR